MANRLITSRNIVFLIALVPALLAAGLAAWALLFPAPERDPEGHPLCPLPPVRVASSFLVLAVALISLAVALGWLGPLGVRRRLLLILITVPLVVIGNGLFPPSPGAC